MKAPLLMIGVGGCGHSMVEGLIGHSFSADVDYVVVDTVAVNASASFPFRMLSIGSDLTKGRGTGGNVALATTIAEANGPLLAELLTERQLIILLTGLGGGGDWHLAGDRQTGGRTAGDTHHHRDLALSI